MGQSPVLLPIFNNNKAPSSIANVNVYIHLISREFFSSHNYEVLSVKLVTYIMSLTITFYSTIIDCWLYDDEGPRYIIAH